MTPKRLENGDILDENGDILDENGDILDENGDIFFNKIMKYI